MHNFQKVARGHHQVLRRADDPKAAAASASTGTSSSETPTPTPTTTPAAKTSTTSSTTSSSSSVSTTAQTSAKPPSPILSISPIIGGTSTGTSTISSTTSSSTTSTSTTTSTTPTKTSTTPAANPVTPIASPARTPPASPTVSSSTTPSGTAGAANSTSTSASSSGLSSAATGGIVAACILVGLALVIFAVRKTFIRRRKRRRNTWGAGVYPEINVTEKYGDNPTRLDAPPVPEKASLSSGYLSTNMGAQPRTPVWAPPRPVSPNPSTYYVTPPPMSYNNAMMDNTSLAAAPVGPRPVSTSSLGWGEAQPQSSAIETAMVRVLYIPTLPDELSITTGEVVQVVKAFDDGWAMCRNARGEQGVVPLECLDRSAAQAHDGRLSVGYGQQEGGGDWRNMKRISSLSIQQPHY
ncbi:hypothetical protein M0805_002700 [Coniferiporia weirii]|nr:hypothetical protein M0805_002700 [Coniferiporia weirii]